MADIGHGISLSFSTLTAVIQGTVDGPGLVSDSVETSHMGLLAPTGVVSRTFIPGLSDSGSLTFEVQLDPNEPDPRTLGVNALTLTWPLPAGDTSPATWSASCFCVSYSASSPMDDLMTASLEFKISGDITITPSS